MHSEIEVHDVQVSLPLGQGPVRRLMWLQGPTLREPKSARDTKGAQRGGG